MLAKKQAGAVGLFTGPVSRTRGETVQRALAGATVVGTGKRGGLCEASRTQQRVA